VAVTGAAQTLYEGVTVTFGATTGHTLNDRWDWTATSVDPLYTLDAGGTKRFYVTQNGTATAEGYFYTSYQPGYGWGLKVEGGNILIGAASGNSCTIQAQIGGDLGFAAWGDHNIYIFDNNPGKTLTISAGSATLADNSGGNLLLRAGHSGGGTGVDGTVQLGIGHSTAVTITSAGVLTIAPITGTRRTLDLYGFQAYYDSGSDHGYLDTFGRQLDVFPSGTAPVMWVGGQLQLKPAFGGVYTTPGVAILCDMPACPGTGDAEILRDSHSIQWHTTMQTATNVTHYADWFAFADASAGTGSSGWTLTSGKDGTSPASRLAVSDLGNVYCGSGQFFGDLSGRFRVGETTGGTTVVEGYNYVQIACPSGAAWNAQFTATNFSLKHHADYAGSQVIEASAATHTDDGTVTNLWTLALTNNYVYTVTATVTARKDNTDNATYTIQTKVWAASGTAYQGDVNVLAIDETAGADWDCTFDVDGDDVRLRVTGVAATTIYWVGDIRYQAVSTDA
jgi:hypothetical protein